MSHGRFVFVLPFLALLGSVSAQAIDDVLPARGAPGTVVEIEFSSLLGAGGAARPRVFLRDPQTLERTPLKVIAHDDAQIRAVLRRGVPGLHDVVVVPEAGAEIVAAGAFEVLPPVFAYVDSGTPPIDHATPGQQVSAVGQSFGGRTGALHVGLRKARIVSWADEVIEFRVPAPLEDGFYSIRIENAVGVTVASRELAAVDSGGAQRDHATPNEPVTANGSGS